LRMSTLLLRAEVTNEKTSIEKEKRTSPTLGAS
jgi:hypothetical protein